jgi:hypothetical protein
MSTPCTSAGAFNAVTVKIVADPCVAPVRALNRLSTVYFCIILEKRRQRSERCAGRLGDRAVGDGTIDDVDAFG